MRTTNKQLIRQACLEVIESNSAKPREKLQAAGILEKLIRMKALATRARKPKQSYKKRVTDDTVSQIDDILSQVAN